jgi:hypothetical protein
MKQLAHQYCLFALVATSISVFFFRKMDKHSFYHHYFKVIEEVELRNSQQISTLPAIWRSAKKALHQFWEGFCQWFIGAFARLVDPRLFALAEPVHRPDCQWGVLLSFGYARLHPPRAP